MAWGAWELPLVMVAAGLVLTVTGPLRRLPVWVAPSLIFGAIPLGLPRSGLSVCDFLLGIEIGVLACGMISVLVDTRTEELFYDEITRLHREHPPTPALLHRVERPACFGHRGRLSTLWESVEGHDASRCLPPPTSGADFTPDPMPLNVGAVMTDGGRLRVIRSCGCSRELPVSRTPSTVSEQAPAYRPEQLAPIRDCVSVKCGYMGEALWNEGDQVQKGDPIAVHSLGISEPGFGWILAPCDGVVAQIRTTYSKGTTVLLSPAIHPYGQASSVRT